MTRRPPPLHVLVALVAGLLALAGAPAAPFASGATPADGAARIGPVLRQPALELPDEVRGHLRLRHWEQAADGLLAMDHEALQGGQRGDWAFLVAWSLVRADRGAEAAKWLPLMSTATNVPAAYADLVRGEVLRAMGEPLEALRWLERVSPDHYLWGRAGVVRAETLRELGRTRDAFALYEQIAERPDPALGNPEALLALGLHHGVGSPEAYPYLRRLWWAYPRSESARQAVGHLSAYRGDAYEPTWQEVGRRAERLMFRREYVAALTATGRVAGQVEGADADACRFVYVRGRSYYRRNQLSNALAAFGEQGDRCDPDDDAAALYGARILYLEGKAQYRKALYEQAAATFTRLAERYPGTTLADDGYTEAGIALQQAGHMDAARERWRRGLEAFPDGDTVPEATWRMAFSLYLEGHPQEARSTAMALAKLPIESDPVHVAAGRYWLGRWLLYPDVDDPTLRDPVGHAPAVVEWRRLCEEMPHSYYAILAYSRLVEEAPEVAADLAERGPDHATGDLDQPWVVPQTFAGHPGARSAIELARLGLIAEALAEWGALDAELLGPDEVAWMTEVRSRAGDWLRAHDDMRSWLKHHPPGTLGPREAQVLRVGYPDRYWPEVQAAAEGDRYEARLLHALIREESNFNAAITSFAGARGLSQLMPATAAEVAGWLGRRVTDRELEDPATNLEIGAKYLDSLHRQYEGSPYLSLAAYNAGPGRVKRWRSEWGDVPSDEYVERIPYKETREYVKRVMGTWQIMRWQFDDGAPFPDLSEYNHHALPE